MRLRFGMHHLVYLALLAVSLGATSYVAWRIAGFLGIGVFGLIVGLIALTVELEGGRPIVHGQAASLYIQFMAAEEKMSSAEKAARRAEIESAALPLLVAKIVSAGLILIGFGAFFAFERGA
ncbi:MAG TPA: hypothetical protein VEZ24_14645 [Microvirga sp.]|nr:hypothetical protein [Microvirga sp.]